MNIVKNFKSTVNDAKEYSVAFLKWLVLGILTGALCGGFGALFFKSISFVTEFRLQNGFMVLFLPVGGILTVALYKLCRVSGIGTNQVFQSVRSQKSVPVLLFPAIFIGSVITHLCGASAGKEGAALQLGGSISSVLGKIFKLGDSSRRILTVCSMGAFFSAVFGTPLGACVFALEVVDIGRICSAAFFPAIISSITAFAVAGFLGVEPERFHLDFIPAFSFDSIWKVVLIAVLTALLSVVFCFGMSTAQAFFKKFFKNEFLRILVGSFVIIALTVLVGSQYYNGGGIEVIHGIFSGEKIRYEAFILKLLFTVISVSVGFKGGEIIPTLFIGSTFGYALAVLIGLNPVFGAAIGMAALFCGVTNCPLATIILWTELFGSSGIVFFALGAVISFFLSGYSSLYSEQKMIYSKLKLEEIKN